MGYKLKDLTLYLDKCTVGTSVERLDAIKLKDPDTGDSKENKNPPKVYIDWNYCGSVYFVTVRPIIIENTELYDGSKLYEKYMPADNTNKGLGRFILPFHVTLMVLRSPKKQSQLVLKMLKGQQVL